jgi:hypothetical protein
MKNRKPVLSPEEAAFLAGATASASAAPSASAAEDQKSIRFTVDLPEVLHRRLKVAAMDRRQPMTDLARVAFAEWLDGIKA